jgi:diamine N-acetyltransferase
MQVEGTMKDIIHYFAPTKAAAASLSAMARQAFSDTFANLYDPDPSARFL